MTKLQYKRRTTINRKEQILDAAIDVHRELGYSNSVVGQAAEGIDASQGIVPYDAPTGASLPRSIAVNDHDEVESYLERHPRRGTAAKDTLHSNIELCFHFSAECKNETAAIIVMMRSHRTHVNGETVENQGNGIDQPLPAVLWLGKVKRKISKFFNMAETGGKKDD